MSGLEARVLTAAEVDANTLDAFLRRFFRSAHCDFLLQHGEWWHRGQQHRFVATVGTQVVGYSAVIPASCLIDGDTRRAYWWVDLFVDPAFRGRGAEALMDRRVRESYELLLGFPNATSARILYGHGWNFTEKHRTFLLPFEPTRLRPVLAAPGARGVALRAAARASRPLGLFLRRRAARYRPATGRKLEDASASALAEIFERHRRADTVTTLRDAGYLDWRYFSAPYRDELAFFVAGDPSPRAAAIARSRHADRGLTVKLLDLFGDLEDSALVTDLLRRVAREAARARAVEVTAFVTLPRLYPAFRAAGFVIRATGRFCWHSANPAIMRLFDRREVHWTFGDSDHEDPA